MFMTSMVFFLWNAIVEDTQSTVCQQCIVPQLRDSTTDSETITLGQSTTTQEFPAISSRGLSSVREEWAIQLGII